MLSDARPIVFDSNLLLVLLVGSFEPRTLRTFKRISEFTAADLRLLQGVSGEWKLLVSPNLLTEVSNLANGLPEILMQGFHDYLSVYIPRMLEVYLDSSSLSADQPFRLFGLGDAAVCRLAQHAPVVTEDGRLRDFLLRRGLPALNLAQMRTL